jgi:hypothetical protein
MKIGDRVILKERIEMYNITYEIGHQFTIVGDDNIRGFDLKDDDGNMLCETRFVKMGLLPLSEIRDRKIDKILNNGTNTRNDN